MVEQRVQRRLAAILAADVVGYSRLMEADEAGTLTVLKARRHDILQPIVAKHHGRLIKVMGDGVLVEFASAVNGVACAVELQRAMGHVNASLPEERRIVLRVGINVGDVIVEGSDLYGDGVNIAARLETLAEPGGVFLSQTVFNHVRGKVQVDFEDLGEQSLKNIVEPVRVYKVSGIVAHPDTRHKTDQPFKVSLAVLPFTNISDDVQQEYFSDGITEDIITDLSKVSVLRVLSRNTVFTFKGKRVEVTKIAKQLNVTHVLEGSVRKVGGRVRITAQLIDANNDSHIWAERYDRDFNDIFALQDEISQAIVTALRVNLMAGEMKAIAARSTKSAEAYDCYLHARATLQVDWSNKAMLRSARRLFQRAVEIDEGYAKAIAGIADCDAHLWIAGDLDVSYQDILANSSKALSLAPDLAEAHASNGVAQYLAGDPAKAIKAFEKAITLDPDLWEAHHMYGYSCRAAGRFEKAALHYERAASLKPDDWDSLAMLADVYESLAQHDLSKSTIRRALVRYEKALGQRPNNADGIALAAAMLVVIGENTKAEEWAKRALVLDPDSYSVRYNVACVHAVIGKPDTALECLEYIYSRVPRARRWLLGTVKHDSQLNALRDRADFQVLVSRLETAAPEQT